MDGYKLFRKDGQGKMGGGVALSVSVCVVELRAGNDKVECLWVRIRGRANKADILFGI